MDALLLPLVVLLAAAGIAIPAPGRWVDRAGAIDPTLAGLVLTAGLSVELADLRQVIRRWPRLLVALASSSAGLPVLAWALSRAASGVVRQGILAAGVAPSEVASVALTGLAGGEVPVAAVLLVGSSLVSVAYAGPVLGLVAHAPALRPLGLLATLAAVVAGPLAGGIVLRRLAGRHQAVVGIGRVAGGVSLLALLWEVASQIHLEAAYLVGAGLLVAFLAGAAGIGVAVSQGAARAARPGVVLPVAMRDFAVAAGIAAAAFGPGSTGVLGIYGLLVLLGGATAAHHWARGRRIGQ